MKNSRRCPKCQNQHLLYVPQIADRFGDSAAHELSTPMKVVHSAKTKELMFGVKAVTTSRAGELEAVICRGCGYTEFYTRDVAELEIDGVHVIAIDPQ